MSSNRSSRPHVHDDLLIFQNESQSVVLTVDTLAWYDWLRTATTFTFWSDAGTFTAHREQAGHKRGSCYWRAYRRKNGMLHRVYLGRTEQLTLEHLRASAATLAAPQISPSQRGTSSHSQMVPVSSGSEHVSPHQTLHHHAEPGTEKAVTKVSARPSSYTLPASLPRLIGREQELRQATTALLQFGVRLLTLTGSGGVGKTCLALHLATELQDLKNFQDGVRFLSLASLNDVTLVLPTLARVFGFKGQSKRSLMASLISLLREQHLLLVLDNMEQVAAVAPSLVELLAACPHLTLLVTSREALHVRDEYELVVEPLQVPSPKQAPNRLSLSPYSAVLLFLERAREVLPTFVSTDERAARIGEICRRLDGLPLAIELAAARLTHLTLEALEDRLEHRLALLTGGARDLPARQQTLRNTIAWSYELLSQEEQRMFRLLSVFSNGCPLQAIEVLHPSPDEKSNQCVCLISALLDKHLLRRSALEHTEPRFHMLETLREFGLECLAASGEEHQIHLAHLQYYLQMVEEAELALGGPQQTTWYDQLEREHENLRVALQWAGSQYEQQTVLELALRLAGSLSRFWVVRGYISEGQQVLTTLLASSKGIAPSAYAKALGSAGWLALWQGEYRQAKASCEQSLALYQALEDARGIALAIYRLGHVMSALGTMSEARCFLEQSVEYFTQLGDEEHKAFALLALVLTALRTSDTPAKQGTYPLIETCLGRFRLLAHQEGMAWSLFCLGLHHLRRQDGFAARSSFEESLALFQTSEYRLCRAHVLYYLGKASVEQEDLPAAQRFFLESLELFVDMHDPVGSAASLDVWGEAVARYGALAWAAQLWGCAEVQRHTTGADLFPLFTLSHEHAALEHRKAAVRMQLGEQIFTKVWAEGCAMTPEDAMHAQSIERLLKLPSSRVQRSTSTHFQRLMGSDTINELTGREREVLHLIAQGLTDTQIAEVLVISPRTVNAHTRSLYSKLGITSRSAATRYALQHHFR